MIRFIFLLAAASIWCSSASAETKSRSVDLRTLEMSLLDKQSYDKRVRPDNAAELGAPLNVTVQTYVRRISDIDEEDMEYKVSLTFRLFWTDERLRFDNVYTGGGYEPQTIVLTDPSNLWIPDVFFSNEIEGNIHGLLKPNYLIRIHPDGEILFSTRVSLKLSCPSVLGAEHITCSVVMASYAYTTDDINLNWHETPLHMSKSIHIRGYQVESYQSGLCTSRTSTGEYSCLKIDFVFKRCPTKNGCGPGEERRKRSAEFEEDENIFLAGA